MARSEARIGLTADLFDTKGRPIFGPAPLTLLDEAGLEWSVLPSGGGPIEAAAFAQHDALFIGGSRVTEAALASDTGRLRVIARNGAGFDAVIPRR